MDTANNEQPPNPMLFFEVGYLERLDIQSMLILREMREMCREV
jgi:hypothetical protein